MTKEVIEAALKLQGYYVVKPGTKICTREHLGAVPFWQFKYWIVFLEQPVMGLHTIEEVIEEL